VDAWQKLAGIDGIECNEMTRRDIVRHRLVQEIVNAYERHEERARARARHRAEKAEEAQRAAEAGPPEETAERGRPPDRPV